MLWNEKNVYFYFHTVLRQLYYITIVQYIFEFSSTGSFKSSCYGFKKNSFYCNIKQFGLHLSENASKLFLIKTLLPTLVFKKKFNSCFHTNFVQLSYITILWILFEFIARDLNAPAAENLKISCTIVIEDNWRCAVWKYKYTFFRFNLFIHPRILVSIYKYTEVTLTSVSVIILHWCHTRVLESWLKSEKSAI